VAHLVVISEQRTLLGSEVFNGILDGKLKQLAAEAKTLDAARMREMEQRSATRSLLCCFRSKDEAAIFE
jgi:hypothetical protein